MVYGSDGLEGKGCTRMRREVAPARRGSWARVPVLQVSDSESFRVKLVSWHTTVVVRKLEGCAVPRRSIRA
jgi:hypothetical protein